MKKEKVIYHGITLNMVEEFLRDYLGTLNTKKLKNEYRSIRSIAEIMGIERERCADFIIVAKENGYLWTDSYNLPSYITFPKLYKVKEV